MTFYEEELRNSSATAYDQRLVPWYFQHWADHMIRLAAPEVDSQAVDVACGSGMITRALLTRLGPRGWIAGVDLNPAMLAHARSTVADRRVTWHVAEASRLPFQDEAVDVVYCHQGLQFFHDRPAAVNEICRILRPGGRVVVAVWGHLEANPEVSALSAAIGEFLGPDAGHVMTAICGFPDRDALGVLLGASGFVDVQVENVRQVARHPDVHDAMDGQLEALPIAASVRALGADRRSELLGRLCEILAPYVDDAGVLSIPATSNLAVARKP
jgi:ubiquinone/menaquinone biosynthesis C-methylase UbiE